MNGFYLSDGARLGFRDSGAGQPVVFLHPTPLDGDYWRPLIEDLGGVRAIVPDLRGHGSRSWARICRWADLRRVPDAPVLTMAQLADDVLALLDHLQCEGSGLCRLLDRRLCAAGVVAQGSGADEGLAFVCSKPQPDAEANLEKRAATIAQARAEGVGALFDGMAQTLIGSDGAAAAP
jgi:3-oxoadipate enol-lactonase